MILRRWTVLATPRPDHPLPGSVSLFAEEINRSAPRFFFRFEAERHAYMNEAVLHPMVTFQVVDRRKGS